MTKIHKTIVNALVLLLLGGAIGYSIAMQQLGELDRKKSGSRRDFLQSMFTERLNLSEPQQEKLGLILDAQLEKIRPIREQFGPQFRAVREETHAKIGEMLTESQIVLLTELKAEMEARRKARWGDSKPKEKQK